MSSLTDFVLARIAADERLARRALGGNAYVSDGPGGRESYVMSAAGERLFTIDMEAMARADESTLALAELVSGWMPGRVLAECEAKRRIVHRHSACDDVAFGDAATCPDMRDLAAMYADHPDYRDEWRP